MTQVVFDIPEQGLGCEFDIPTKIAPPPTKRKGGGGSEFRPKLDFESDDLEALMLLAMPPM